MAVEVALARRLITVGVFVMAEGETRARLNGDHDERPIYVNSARGVVRSGIVWAKISATCVPWDPARWSARRPGAGAGYTCQLSRGKAGNRALFTLYEIWNALVQYQKEAVANYRGRPDAWFNLPVNRLSWRPLSFQSRV